uniref:HlyD family efflux transporter periplasmic adaptor subunit n=1 Tax=Eiseniibacteriota bacterium TaxID=2212470 RepID=A0A832I2K2_UNCEI
MDIPRVKPHRSRAPMLLGVAAAVVLGSVGVSRLRPAAPEVERSSLWIDTVRRGTMVREVRGAGTLVPESQRIVSALTAGRVDRVLARPGARVEAGTILLEISNPDVELQALDAERQLKLAEADLASLRASLESQRLVAESDAAAATSELREAERQAAVAERLTAEGLASGMETERARDRVESARVRARAEARRLVVLTEALAAQLELRRLEVERLRAVARVQRERVASMRVAAGAAGVVQELSLEPGEWVNPGQALARVAGPERLKAVVRVPELQARDLAIGLPAVIDTRNGTVAGRVSRVDPAVQGGTVAVDLAIEGALPKGARPDLSVDATIQIEKLDGVLYVGRPAEGSSESEVRLFRIERDGHTASRVPVALGRGSANTVEIRSGLAAGDKVILSEMSRWDGVDRVRLR